MSDRASIIVSDIPATSLALLDLYVGESYPLLPIQPLQFASRWLEMLLEEHSMGFVIGKFFLSLALT